MFGADMSVLQAIAFFVSISQHALGFRRERQFYGRRNLLAQQRTTFYFFADRFD
jgi:hypothetical protein